MFVSQVTCGNPTNVLASIVVTCLALSVTLGSSQYSRADLIYDAFTDALNTGGAITTRFGDTAIALGFRTTATAYRLASIDMGVFYSDPETFPDPPVTATGDVVFSIYSADESAYPPTVASLLQNISGNVPITGLPDGGVTNPSYSLTGLNVALVPDTYYYLVASYPTAPTTGNLYWNQAFGIQNTNPAYNYQYSTLNNGVWGFPQPNNGSPLKATINAVPEPGTLALAAFAGLAGLAAARRRRKHQA